MRTQSMAPKLESRILRWLFTLIMESKSSCIRIYILKESHIQDKFLNICSLKPTIQTFHLLENYIPRHMYIPTRMEVPLIPTYNVFNLTPVLT